MCELGAQALRQRNVPKLVLVHPTIYVPNPALEIFVFPPKRLKFAVNEASNLKESLVSMSHRAVLLGELKAVVRRGIHPEPVA